MLPPIPSQIGRRAGAVPGARSLAGVRAEKERELDEVVAGQQLAGALKVCEEDCPPPRCYCIVLSCVEGCSSRQLTKAKTIL